jgi:hypothetical protein
MMGYTTEFWGEVMIDPPLNEAEAEYLRKFANTRRMYRKKGPYFVDGSGDFGQGHDPDIIDFNNPDPSQPGLWCQWVPTPSRDALEWDGGEKFYDSVEWMQYIINHFLKPGAFASRSGDPQFTEFTFDHTLNGVIDAQGEDPEDRWKLVG